MKKTAVFILFACVLISAWTQPLPQKNHHSLIIDTDCGTDDLQAIALMVSRPEITINAVIVSEGTNISNNGYQKIKELIHEYGSGTIPIAFGSDVIPVLNEAVSRTNEKITWVCLGPLTNTAKYLNEDAKAVFKVDRIVWYNDPDYRGVNYLYDTVSAIQVLDSEIRTDIISNLGKKESTLDSTFLLIVKNANTSLSHFLRKLFNQSGINEKLRLGNLCAELIPVYISNPELFAMNRLKEDINIRFNLDYDVVSVKEVISDMVTGKYVANTNIVFNEFPQKREFYAYDVRHIIDSAISKYGTEEWKAIVMTDEFHGHLGVFSIVGAKMGIKARDVFGVGTDMIEVTTFAGSRPPYSCMNDGIQVSTGATLGMGTIRLAEDSIVKPSAIFTYKSRSLLISLKEEYLRKVDADISEGIVKFGLMDDGYWRLIRRNAIKYWLTWDRDEIFDIKESEVKPN